jgi:hypothetical protein
MHKKPGNQSFSRFHREAMFASKYLVSAILVATFVGRKGAAHFGSTFPGSAVSDSGYVAGYFSAIHASGTNPFSSSSIDLIAWPAGLRNHGVLNATSPLSIAVQWFLSGIFNAATAQFVLGFIGVVFTFLVSAYALRNLEVHKFVVPLGACLVAISPMMLQWWSANPPYAQNWIFVLVIWAAVKYCKGPTLRRGFCLGGAILVGVTWSQYFAVFCLILGAVSYLIAWHETGGKRVLSFASVFSPSFICIVVYFLISRLDTRQIPVRASSDSSKLYLHLNEILDGNRATYFGVGLLAFSLIPFLNQQFFSQISKKMMLFCYLSALALLVFFSNPKVGPIPLPGRLVSFFIPQIRSGWYAAQPIQVILVFICACVLTQILSSGQKKLKSIGVILFAILLVFDNYRIPITEKDRWMSPAPQESISVKTLSQLPPGAVAHFPWELSNEYPYGPLPTPCLYLDTHRHPIVNSCGIHYSSNDTFPTIEKIQKTAGCGQVRLMRSLNIRYLLIEAAYAQPVLMSCLKSPNSWRIIMDNDGLFELWELAT